MMLEKDTPVALWRQMRIVLREKATKELRPGSQLPTEQELCSQYGVSRITVRQAISSLVKEGILATQRGRGTYVLPPRITTHLDNSPVPVEGKESRVVLYSVDRIAADPWQADRLRVEAGEPLHRIRRVRLVEEEPIAYLTLFLPVRLFPGFTRTELDSENLSQLIASKSGMAIINGEETIQCIQADSFRSNVLKIPVGSPLLVVETISYLASGEVRDFSRAYHRADRTQLTRIVSGSQLHSSNW